MKTYKLKSTPVDTLFETRTKSVDSISASQIFRKAYEHDNNELNTVECFYILMLNTNSNVIGSALISIGNMFSTIADQKVILKHCIDNLCSRVILCHNHPSGNINPSKEDIELTDKIKTSAKLLGIDVLDHLILTNSSYYSFCDEGII